MYRCVFLLVCYVQMSCSFAWNAVGHDVVAAVAMGIVSPEAKQRIERLNGVLNPVFPTQDVITAAHWMDELQYRSDKWMANRHYITLGESFDGSTIPETPKPNAATAIDEAMELVADKHEKNWNKAFALRMLLHIIGDIHQPLHTISIFSVEYPNGDRGGNLVALAPNSIGPNLHAYWDNGGGLFLISKPNNAKKIQKMASDLRKQYPCDVKRQKIAVMRWIEESHQLALDKVHTISAGSLPSQDYQAMTKEESGRRVALAGCRLAAVLEGLFGE